MLSWTFPKNGLYLIQKIKMNELNKQEQEMKESSKILLDIKDLREETINQLILERVTDKKIRPELVEYASIKNKDVYKRFQNLEKKDRFREKLLNALCEEWKKNSNEEGALNLKKLFEQWAGIMENDGALILGELIENSEFKKLVEEYDNLLEENGSGSWIHSYIDFRKYPDFLAGNNEYKDAFLHPLLVALLAYRLGGPIRMVDARGKDAEPISVQAQDNMLHIDNTPFNAEYKILMTWEKHKASGPVGQNFVFIPGTHKGVRNCLEREDGSVWSTENASIFIENESIQNVFDLQRKIRSNKTPLVLEATHKTKPLTTVFFAGALVHHRRRTLEGSARSCMILAFHLAGDNPGQFMTLNESDLKSLDAVDHFIFGSHGKNTDDEFIMALVGKANKISEKMTDIENKEGVTKIVELEQIQLSDEELEKWKATTTRAPTVEEKKQGEGFFPLEESLTFDGFIHLLTDDKHMMAFDKHGPLDLILYSDNHEEPRKWARNRIREMPIHVLKERFKEWENSVIQPETQHLLTTKELKKISDQLVSFIENLNEEQRKKGFIDEDEKITSEFAYKSVRQLINDLGETITRCASRQAFLSTSLFLFLACDELYRLHGEKNQELKEFGKNLLSNYIATNIVIEKQITIEKKLSKDFLLTKENKKEKEPKEEILLSTFSSGFLGTLNDKKEMPQNADEPKAKPGF
jgi:hypothetical protein